MFHNFKIQHEKPIALVGLMGAGKTTIGKKLAKYLSIDFFDTDEEIEKTIGKKIPIIFSTFGEKTFREYEKKVIKTIFSGRPAVVATGGGAFMDADTRALINNTGISIWIKADIETLVKRIDEDGTRPLLKNQKKRDVLEHLISERYPIYSKADITIISKIEPIEKTLQRLISALEKDQLDER